MDESECGEGGGNAGEHAHEDFHAGVAEQFLELFFRQVVFMQQFVNNLVQKFGLLAGRCPDALGIEHHYQGKGTTQCKNGGDEPHAQAEGSRESSRHCGVGTGHAAGADHVAEIKPSILDQTANHLYALGDEPTQKGSPETRV